MAEVDTTFRSTKVNNNMNFQVRNGKVVEGSLQRNGNPETSLAMEAVGTLAIGWSDTIEPALVVVDSLIVANICCEACVVVA